MCHVWTEMTDDYGWMKIERGQCRITVPPDGPTARAPVRLTAPGCSTEHTSVTAAKRAAATRLNRGW